MVNDSSFKLESALELAADTSKSLVISLALLDGDLKSERAAEAVILHI